MARTLMTSTRAVNPLERRLSASPFAFFDRDFGRLAREMMAGNWPMQESMGDFLRPQMNISETDKDYCVTVDLPDGMVLPGYGGADLSVPPERLFYEAQVDGEVEGTAFGRPSVRLDHVGEPRQMVPRWLRRNVR